MFLFTASSPKGKPLSQDFGEEGVTFLLTSRGLAGAVPLVFLPCLSGHGIHSVSEPGQG